MSHERKGNPELRVRLEPHLLNRLKKRASQDRLTPGEYVRRMVEEDLDMLETPARDAVIQHPVMLITINRLFREGMSAEELYEATRGAWKIGAQREKTQYVLAVFKGVVQEVYRVHGWFPAGTLEYRTRDTTGWEQTGRWEFEGSVAADIRHLYVGRSVKTYLRGQNPIRYVI